MEISATTAKPKRMPIGGLCLESLGAFAELARNGFGLGSEARLGEKFKRWLLMAGFLPVFGLLQLLHWVCFGLDELLFPRYRGVVVRRPLFILGPPRSGTTHLHRVLAEDRDRFTTLLTWELFLAPSIVQKKLVRAAAAADRRLGRPLARLIAVLERGVLRGADDLHPSALRAPEEDYFLLCMTLACSGLVLVFPRSRRLWSYAFLDPRLSARDRDRTLAFYHACLQKHLYVAGEDRQLLSKNASFNPWVRLLDEAYPDASFVFCARDPERTVPSMLSVADAARRAFGGERSDPAFEENMVSLMRHHYESVGDVLPLLPAHRREVMLNRDLHRRLETVVLALYRRLGMTPSVAFRQRLRELHQASCRYRSPHQYDSGCAGRTATQLNQEFASASSWIREPAAAPEEGDHHRTPEKARPCRTG